MHGGGGPQVSEVTPSTWGAPNPCKQALKKQLTYFFKYKHNHLSLTVFA